MTVWRLLGKDKTACVGRMWCRYYTKYKIMIRLFDWHMYNATIHISTWKQRKLTQQWQKFGFKALLLKWTQRVTAWNRARVCCNAVHFGLRHEIVKVFQKRSEQLVLIPCVCVCVCVCAQFGCHIHDFAIWKEAAVFLFLCTWGCATQVFLALYLPVSLLQLCWENLRNEDIH